jgi:hypothetical protein
MVHRPTLSLKLKLLQCLIKTHSTKEYLGVEVKLYELLKSALYGGEKPV